MYIRRRGLEPAARRQRQRAARERSRGRIPSSGTVTEIQSVASSQFDALSVNLNYCDAAAAAVPRRQLHASADRSTRPTAPFSLPAEQLQPRRRARAGAAGIARHRFMSMVNLPLRRRVSPRHVAARAVGAAVQHHDRTRRQRRHGQQRSTVRASRATAGCGRAQVDLGLRLSWRIGFGGPAAPPAGPQVRIVRGDSADPLGSMGGGPTAGTSDTAWSSTRSRTTAEPHQRAELQRRRDVAVLRTADVGGPAAARRARRAGSRSDEITLTAEDARARKDLGIHRPRARDLSGYSISFIALQDTSCVQRDPDGDGEVQRIDIAVDRDAHAIVGRGFDRG